MVPRRQNGAREHARVEGVETICGCALSEIWLQFSTYVEAPANKALALKHTHAFDIPTILLLIGVLKRVMIAYLATFVAGRLTY